MGCPLGPCRVRNLLTSQRELTLNLRRFATSAFLLSALLGASACQSASKGSVGLKRVDDLVSRIEAVHVEVELSRATMEEALNSLKVIAVPDYQGDIMLAFDDYMRAVEASKEQATALRAVVIPMRRAAEPFFTQWEANMNDFASPTMRERSRDRQIAARARYDTIVEALEPLQTTYDVFNLTLNDIGLFLEHDFNAGAILGITGEVRSLENMAGELNGRMNTCLEAARSYVQNNSLPMQVVVQPPTPVEPEVTEEE